ncbi:MbeD/MobD family mobilization/exclusion protein [Klebsiella pneumoniae]|uniref:MbeD/MobD family mobilization/exclusion protein n=1 Tax=Klebsiella pneumoniae TaxID=573 RepID=UPI0022B738CC|nr:MbeD/MobD family mobilization/exclusion protein [Klebsiella pneumoniae]
MLSALEQLQQDYRKGWTRGAPFGEWWKMSGLMQRRTRAPERARDALESAGGTLLSGQLQRFEPVVQLS